MIAVGDTQVSAQESKTHEVSTEFKVSEVEEQTTKKIADWKTRQETNSLQNGKISCLQNIKEKKTKRRSYPQQ